MRRLWAATAILAFAACNQAPPPKEDVPRLAVDGGWPSIPAGAKFAEISAVDVDAQGNVYVLQRAGRMWEEPFPQSLIPDPTVLVFSPSGQLIAQWGADRFIMPHGISIDPQGKVWITDVGREQVFRFGKDGTLELTIGERGVSRQDATHFGRPADIAFLGDNVLVADGYVNTRVAEFDRNGNFLREFGDFAVAHAVAVDDRFVYVADRENARIQLFSHEGKLVDTWDSPADNHTYGLKPLGEGRVLAVEGRDAYDRKGAILRYYAADGSVERSLDLGQEGEDASLGHDLAIGPGGIIYMTDVPGNRVVRFDPSAATAGQTKE